MISTPLAYKNDCYSNLDKATVDVDRLIETRKSYLKKPMTVHLNINLVRNIDIFCIDETKLYQRFLNVNFI